MPQNLEKEELDSRSLKEREVIAMELAAMQGRDWLTADQAAIYIGVSLFTLQDLGRTQQIPNSQRRKFRYYRKTDLDAWMAGNPLNGYCDKNHNISINQ